MEEVRRIVVVAGPTSSGKSDLAISLARKFNGEIISADSRQVYRGMDLGTGKVTKTEQRAVRHWMLDVASPKRQYSVAQWKHGAERALRNIMQRGKLPIVCGGTGFWIDALVYGTKLPNVKPNSKLRARLEKLTTLQLFAKLQKLDLVRAANIDQYNRRRLVRAIEIVTTTGKFIPLPVNGSPYELLYLVLAVPHAELARRIAKRLDARLRAGMLDETRQLHRSGVSWGRLESFGLEYRWAVRFLRGNITVSEMREGMLRENIAYAKRQITWFKRNKKAIWLTKSSRAETLVRQFLAK